MKCPICEKTEFENLDRLRNLDYWFARDMRYDRIGFCICKNCGYVTYDMEGINLREIYERQRPVMRAENVITGNRKNLYHKHFLEDYLEKINSVLDVGCANGSFLRMLAMNGKECFGSEYSTAFRNYAKKIYGLEVTEEPDWDKQYDMIVYYHVLEHIPDPVAELKRAVKSMKKYIYISVPIWLETLDEASGSLTADFENLYHLNHCCVFSNTSFQNVLNKVGLKIIKKDTRIYGTTVLCEKRKPQPIEKENYQDIIKKIETQRLAIQNLDKEGYKIYAKFPDAYIFAAQKEQKNFENAKKILMSGINVCGENTKLMTALAKLHIQWDENTPNKNYYSNNIRRAEEIYTRLLEIKPSEECYYYLGIINGKYKNDKNKAIEYLRKVQDINPMQWATIENIISSFVK